MPWFAGHIIMAFRYKTGEQHSIPVYENIVLIEAENSRDAHARALARGREDEGDSAGSLTWGGRPARMVCEGVRKVVECERGARPDSGSEVSYSEFEVGSEASLRALVAGESVDLTYAE
jgi:hypothetical protein